MAKRQVQAKSNKFSRTRDDHATEIAEDYVEAIAEIQQAQGQCRSAELARLFQVSHVTVNKTIARLQSAGLVISEPYAPVGLTRKGQRLAEACRERHEIVLKFLRAIGVDEATARADAEGIEHHVSKTTLECFQRIIEQKLRSGG